MASVAGTVTACSGSDDGATDEPATTTTATERTTTTEGVTVPAEVEQELDRLASGICDFLVMTAPLPAEDAVATQVGPLAELVRSNFEQYGPEVGAALQTSLDSSIRTECPGYASALTNGYMADLERRPPGSTLILDPAVAQDYANSVCSGGLTPQDTAEVLTTLNEGAVDEVAQALVSACENGAAFAAELIAAAQG